MRTPSASTRAMAKTSEALTPVGLSAGEAVRAARLEWDDYEKCLVSLCAGKAKADYLVTRDPAAFARSLIPVRNPWESGFAQPSAIWALRATPWSRERAAPKTSLLMRERLC